MDLVDLEEKFLLPCYFRLGLLSLSILQFLHKGVVSILHHMLISDAIHGLRNEGPSESVLLNQLDQSEVFLSSPMCLGDGGIEVVIPLFPAF